MVSEAVHVRMTDIKCMNGRMAVEPDADGVGMEGKDVEQQRDEQEKAGLSHNYDYRIIDNSMSSKTNIHIHSRL